MTRIILDCFEELFSVDWDSIDGGAEISEDCNHHGESSFKCSSNMPTAEQLTKNTSETEIYFHLYVYPTDLTCYGAGDAGVIAYVRATDGTRLSGVGIHNNAGTKYWTIVYWNGAATVSFDTDIVVDMNTWTEFKVYYLKGVSGKATLWIGDTLQADFTINNNTKTPQSIKLGHENFVGLSGTYTFYIDCFEANTLDITRDECIIWHGGPYVEIGEIVITLSANISGGDPLNIPYSRTSDTLQLIADKTITPEFVPYEWWFGYDGKLYFKEKRGSDKSASIHLVAGDQIGGSKKEQITKQTSQRVRVVGRGESAEQDRNTSDWHESEEEEENVRSFYERIETEKTLSSKELADIWAQVLLAQNAPIRNEITLVLTNDWYTAEDYDLGDEVTATDPDTGISDVYRVKTIEKWIVPERGETVYVTVSKRRTDIIDRLSSLYKTLQRMIHSSTYLDNLYSEGGKQTKLDPSKVEDVWEQTASNKWATDLPEDEADATDIMESCAWVGRGAIAWACDKEEFEVYGTAANAAGEVFLYDPLLKYSRDPRFTCEFEIDTDGVDRDEWGTGDLAYIRIWERNALCGAGDPTNPNKYCCLNPDGDYGNRGFGFHIVKTAANYELKAFLLDSLIQRDVKVANVAIDTKYIIEARMEWKEKVVKYYFGKSDVDKDDPDGFRLRAILPISLLAEDSDDLCPFEILIQSAGGAQQMAIVIYRWKTQAIRAVEG